jgi:hypothetical protein
VVVARKQVAHEFVWVPPQRLQKLLDKVGRPVRKQINFHVQQQGKQRAHARAHK